MYTHISFMGGHLPHEQRGSARKMVYEKDTTAQNARLIPHTCRPGNVLPTMTTRDLCSGRAQPQ
jgi:hypothetical protein